MEGLRVGLKGALRASLGEQVAVMVGLRGPDRPVYMAGDPRTPLGSVLGEKQARRSASTGSIVSVETPFGPGRGTIVMRHTCWYVNAKKRGEIRIHTDFLGFEIWLSVVLYFIFVQFVLILFIFFCTIYYVQNSSFFISVIGVFSIRFCNCQLSVIRFFEIDNCQI